MTTTEFTNEQVIDEQYPDIHDIETEQLDPEYASTNRKLLITTTVIIALLFIAARFQPWIELNEQFALVLSAIGAVLTTIFLLFTIYHWFADPLKSYALREHDLSYSSGLFFRSLVTQPITRIQHIELKRGPIERKIGLATLQVFSAGGAMHTFEIPGLPLTRAQQIRQLILQHKDSVKHG